MRVFYMINIQAHNFSGFRSNESELFVWTSICTEKTQLIHLEILYKSILFIINLKVKSNYSLYTGSESL